MMAFNSGLFSKTHFSSTKPLICTGGGYGDLGNCRKRRFSHKRTWNVDTRSYSASFLYLNGRFKSTFAAVFARFWRSTVFPKPHLVHFHPSKLLPKHRSTCFRASKVFSLLPSCNFTLQKYSRSLAWRVFGFREYSRGFPGVFSTLKSTYSPPSFGCSYS